MLDRKFISYRDLANELGISYNQVARVHAKRIINMYQIDVSRLPRRGVLPLDVCEEYFNVTKKTNQDRSAN